MAVNYYFLSYYLSRFGMGWKLLLTMIISFQILLDKPLIYTTVGLMGILISYSNDNDPLERSRMEKINLIAFFITMEYYNHYLSIYTPLIWIILELIINGKKISTIYPDFDSKLKMYLYFIPALTVFIFKDDSLSIIFSGSLLFLFHYIKKKYINTLPQQ